MTRKKQQKQVVKLTSVMLILIFTLQPHTTNAIDTSNIPLMTLNQGEVTIPHIRITQINLSNELPTDGDIVNVTFTLRNNDSINYVGLTLVAIITEYEAIPDPHRTEEPKTETIVNTTLPLIPANSTTIVQETFVAESGQFTLNAFIMFGDSMIPNSNYQIIIQVLSPPVGDDKTLMIALTGIFTFLGAIMLTPTLIDIIIRKRNNNKTMSTKA